MLTPVRLPSNVRRMWALPLAGLAATVALAAAVFAVRVVSLLSTYRLTITEGTEGLQVYAVWRAIHGFALYEWPNRDHFTLTPYNFLFYRTYGALLQLAHVDGEGILLWGRVITLGFAVAGCLAYAALLRGILPAEAKDRYGRAWILLVAPLVWFGTNFAAWWPLSIRPDLPALCFVTVGLWATVAAARKGSLALFAMASLAFWVAWAFKQSMVLTPAAAGVYLLIRRRSVRETLALGLPFAALAAVTLAAATPEMRYNFYVVPKAPAYHAALAVGIAARILAQNALLWVAALAALASRRREDAGDVAPRLLGVVFGVGVLGGAVTLGLEGANKNHLFEAYAAAGLLASYYLLVARSRPAAGRWAKVLPFAAALLTLPMIAFPAAQLVWTNRFGVTRLADAGQYQRRAAVAALVDALPKPVLVSDDILAQPWHASGGAYPSYVVDPLWVVLGRQAGFITGEGPGILFRTGAVRSGVVPADGELRRAAESGGFACGRVVATGIGGTSYVVCERPPARSAERRLQRPPARSAERRLQRPPAGGDGGP